jgi:hypothetical protein
MSDYVEPRGIQQPPLDRQHRKANADPRNCTESVERLRGSVGPFWHDSTVSKPRPCENNRRSSEETEPAARETARHCAARLISVRGQIAVNRQGKRCGSASDVAPPEVGICRGIGICVCPVAEADVL